MESDIALEVDVKPAHDKISREREKESVPARAVRALAMPCAHCFAGI